MFMLETLTRRLVAGPRITLRSVLARLIAADASYRASRHVARLSDADLRDVGLSRDARGALGRR